MSIKSDRWIRRMAQEHGMIEPFEAGQVKRHEGARLISYGTSSYGYDMRVADEFKIFTNIRNAIVDPKGIDEHAFVSITADDILIPPNSFALARSVEKFKIPRNVLAIVLGKCVTGDTRVVDAASGDYLPISEFADRSLTLGLERWRPAPLPVSHFHRQGVKPVFELRTRGGRRIKATANHPFLRFQGWTPLEALRPGDRIAVAREVPCFGRTRLQPWEPTLLGLMIAEGQCHTPGHSPVFTTADERLARALKEAVALSGLGEVTFNGQYGYRCVNRSGRGGVAVKNRFSRWLESYGLAVHSAAKFVPRAVFRAPKDQVREFLQALFAGDGSFQNTRGARIEYYSDSRRLVEDVNHLLARFGVVSQMKVRTIKGRERWRVQITDALEVKRFAAAIGFLPGCVKDRALQDAIDTVPDPVGVKFDVLPDEAWPAVVAATRRSGTSLTSLGIRKNVSSRSTSREVARQAAIGCADAELLELVDKGPVWDLVESIEPAGEEETFDVTVPGAHNFFANGMVVHNSTYARCGIVVNVTPLEPAWEGYVTIEISNTTPLPAKIYANEGIAQVLFYESDEQCETSYADKGGKYQNQPPQIVLPKLD